jgi:hypothetical protein
LVGIDPALDPALDDDIVGVDADQTVTRWSVGST